MTTAARASPTVKLHRRGMPRERTPDSTGALLLDPFRWIAKRARAHGSDAFEARLLGERAVCVTGPNWARAFYDSTAVSRQGAFPKPVLKVLQDEGSVTTLDGAHHAVRKAMFMSLMTESRLEAAAALLVGELRTAVPRWRASGDVIFDTAIAEVLTRAVCRWAGLPLADREVALRAADLQAMFDGAGGPGPRYVRAAVARARTERWITALVRQLRSGEVVAEPGTAAAVIAAHQDEDGPLDDEIVMTELINVIRPTVAVGRYLTFAMLSLHAHPHVAEALGEARSGQLVDDPGEPIWRFVQEVRRTAPFFPFMAGRTREATELEGYAIPEGRRIMLDLYGTNHDPSAWEDPQEFRPSRFAAWTGDPYRLVPQGAGDHLGGHRCPGEWLTITLMRAAIAVLTREITYEVPPQDLSVSMRRVPARPASGLLIRGVGER